MYQWIPVLCLITIVTDMSSENKSEIPIGEHLDPREQYIFVVALANIDTQFTNNTYRFCTASMLTPEWAITAAHCTIFMSNLAGVYIWYGQYTKSPLVTKLYSQVLSVLVHPDYNYAHLTSTTLKNDVCMLHTEQVKLGRYARVASNDYKNMMMQPVTYVHSGRKMGKDNLYDMAFKEARLSPCAKKVYQLVGKQFVCVSLTCTAMKIGTTDNGGPLLYDGFILAVSSGRFMGYVDMKCFVPIVDYIEWIRQVVKSTHGT